MMFTSGHAGRWRARGKRQRFLGFRSDHTGAAGCVPRRKVRKASMTDDWAGFRRGARPAWHRVDPGVLAASARPLGADVRHIAASSAQGAGTGQDHPHVRGQPVPHGAHLPRHNARRSHFRLAWSVRDRHRRRRLRPHLSLDGDMACNLAGLDSCGNTGCPPFPEPAAPGD
jgi:hypothetical protein